MGGSVAKEVERKIELGIGEIILVSLILFEVAEFLDFLNPDMIFVKKLIEWASFGYLLYGADFTEILFGYKDKIMDLSIIFAYFLLIMKDLIVFSSSIAISIGSAENSYFMPLYIFIRDYAYQFEIGTFYAGALLLLIIACANLFLNVEIKKPSIMGMLHREGPSVSLKERLGKAATTFIVLVVFYILVFNLIMEWLGWVINTPILVLGIFFYFFVFIKYSKRFDVETYFYKVGDAGSEFFKNVIRLLHSKETIMTAVTGLLMLHLITDIGVFILPYILGREVDYITGLGPGHEAIISLMRSSAGLAEGTFMKSLVYSGYALNVIAAVCLLFGPAFVWYELYKKKKLNVPRIIYFLFYTSVSYLLLNPVFSIRMLSEERVVGVNVLTNSLGMNNLQLYLAISVGIGLIALALSCFEKTKMSLKYIMFAVLGSFFAYYILLFSIDVIRFYVNSLLSGGPIVITVFMFIFLTSTVVFYLSGIVYFLYISFYELHKKEV